MDLRRITVALPVVGFLAAVLVLGVAGCSDTRPCPGQCGPPFQLTVIFHHRTSNQARQAALLRCAARNPQVVRIGRIQLRPLSAGAKPDPQAMVYTRSMGGGGAASSRLIACLKGEPTVVNAVYFD